MPGISRRGSDKSFASIGSILEEKESASDAGSAMRGDKARVQDEMVPSPDSTPPNSPTMRLVCIDLPAAGSNNLLAPQPMIPYTFTAEDASMILGFDVRGSDVARDDASSSGSEAPRHYRSQSLPAIVTSRLPAERADDIEEISPRGQNASSMFTNHSPLTPPTSPLVVPDTFERRSHVSQVEHASPDSVSASRELPQPKKLPLYRRVLSRKHKIAPKTMKLTKPKSILKVGGRDSRSVSKSVSYSAPEPRPSHRCVLQ
jgi:hypothetical protein